jgi:hypothetical protein
MIGVIEVKSSNHKIKGNAVDHPEVAQGSPVNSLNSEAMRAEVQALAYRLWTKRGCPIGSPEVDWFEAEEQVLKPRTAAIAAA